MSRYLPVTEVDQFYQDIMSHPLVFKRILGQSVSGQSVYCYQFGKGQTKILAWSQMHGNESTSTRALMQFCRWLLSKNQSELLAQLSFYAIPQLNPDGANSYRRHNAAGIDINRDAIKLRQPESRILNEIFQELQPQLSLNLHDQNTKHSVGIDGKPAAISFLAPATDSSNKPNPAQRIARQLIVSVSEKLQLSAPETIGRFQYDYNPNCFGEHFASQGTPTVTMEAGHYPNDYQRHQATNLYAIALQATITDFVEKIYKQANSEAYEDIPQNVAEFVDLIIKYADLIVDGQNYNCQELAVMFHEKLTDNQVVFTPLIIDYGQHLNKRSHYKITSKQTNPLIYQTDISNHYNFIEDPLLLKSIYKMVPSLKNI